VTNEILRAKGAALPVTRSKWHALVATLGYLFCFLTLACLSRPPAAAREAPGTEDAGAARSRPLYQMEEVVVTASGIEEPIKKTARNVTVITAEEIARAPSNNVVDLLAREANVNLQSFFGNDKDAGVDIRGQGITSVSNVLVLVDGFRLNPPDLAGPDLTAVPLEQIERIEIVRGAGSVLYGDGAVGGVVNIITKKGGGETEGSVTARIGSYDALDAKASVGGRLAELNYNLNAGYSDTDGYRDNGFYRRTDAGFNLGYDVSDTAALSFSGTFKTDENGFPGGVPIEWINDRTLRRQTRSPEDSGESDDLRLLAGAELFVGKWGEFSAKAGYRSRENEFILGFTPLKSTDEQRSRIDEETASLDLFYRKDFTVGEREQILRCGLNSDFTDYITERPDQRVRKNGLVDDIGVFAHAQGDLTAKLAYNLGFRYNHYGGEFRTDDLRDFGGEPRWVNGETFDRDWDNNAVDFGLVYTLFEDTVLFASFATSFRIPNVDELALAVDELRPQEGEHIDVGLRHSLAERGELSLTVFEVTTENEIFFDNINQVNRNFEQDTRRRGVEAEFRLYPLASLYVWGNYTYLEAKFKGLDTFVPLVPEHSAALGLEWRLFKTLLLAVSGTYVDSKFDGNDLTNERFAKIDAYTVVDTKLTWTWKQVEVFAGINNIFDEFYSTLAFSETYFTMPTRNYFGGLQWRF
jgi:outer membrane receptor protein involved in Fe transport